MGNSGRKRGGAPWNKGTGAKCIDCGKHLTSKSKRCRSCHLLFKRGKNHWNWKGGRGTERHRLMSQSKYKKWRLMVFERDNYACQGCGASGGYLMAHHIKPWAEHRELRYELTNGITYCKDCHAKNDKSYAKFYQIRMAS